MFIGYETEYGISGAGCDPGVASMQLFKAACKLPHLNGPGQAGIFLTNGSRFYIDCSHPEIATAEVDDPFLAVVHLLAGDELLQQLATQVVPAETSPRLFKTNVCHTARTTYAAHESYSHRCHPALFPKYLLPFLASRIVLAGAGGLSLHPGIEFVISPRATFLLQDIGGSSTSNRGIFHTKDEPLAGKGWHRLHVLCGESLCSHRANLLRIGTTALLVALLDEDIRPSHPLAFAGSAAEALARFNRDPTLKLQVELSNGRRASALDIQREYLRFVEEHLERLPAWAGQVCDLWRETLALLEQGPEAVATMLDWAIKHQLFVQHIQRRGFSMEELSRWNLALTEDNQVAPVEALPLDVAAHVARLLETLPTKRAPFTVSKTAAERFGLDPQRLEGVLKLRNELCEFELRFSELSARGLFNQLDSRRLLSHRLPQVSEQAIREAVHDAPASGRAGVRGRMIRQLANRPERFACDWHGVFDLEQSRKIDLADPSAQDANWISCPRAETASGWPDVASAQLARRYSRAEAAFNLGDYQQAADLLSNVDEQVAGLPAGSQEHWYELLAFSEARQGELFKARRACRRMVRLLGRDSFVVCATVVSTLRFCGLVPHPSIAVWLRRGDRMVSRSDVSRTLSPYNVRSFTYHWARTLTVQGELERARALLEPLLQDPNFLSCHPRMSARAQCDLADTLRRLNAHEDARRVLQLARRAHEEGGLEGDLADHSLAALIKLGNDAEAREALVQALAIQQRLNLRMGWARSLCLGARRFPDTATGDDTLQTLQRLSAQTPSLRHCRVFRRITERWSDWLQGAPHPEIDDFYWGI